MDRLKSLCLSSVILVGGLGGGVAWAGGYHYPDLGAAALSRGGAFTARADDPTALYYNPAAAANRRGTHISININLVHENVYYTNVSYDGAGTATRAVEVRNSDNVFPIPFVAVTTDLGILDRINMSMLIGVYAPNANRSHTFPSLCKRDAAGNVIDPCQGTDDTDPAKSSPAPQRYDLIFREATVVYPSIGLAWKPFKNFGIPLIADLAFGAVLQLAFNQLKFEQSLGVLNGGLDVYAEVEATSGIVPVGQFGVHWRPLPFLEVGISGRTPHSYTPEGELCATSVPAPGEARDRCKATLGGALPLITPNPVRIAIDVPQEWGMRTGVRYVHRDAQERELFDIEFDFVYEATSRVQDLTVRYLDDVSTALGPLDRPVQVPHRWIDTFGFSLGGSVTAHDVVPDGQLIFRGGAFLETNGAPEEYTRLDFLPFFRYGMSVGVGVKWGRYAFDLGYSHVFHQSRTVGPNDPSKGTCGAEAVGDQVGDTGTNCGSRILLLDPSNRATGVGRAVGNGDYDVDVDQVMFAASVAFGEGSH